MNASPLDASLSAILPSVIVGLLLLIFRKELLHYLRELPLTRFRENRWMALFERERLLKELHDNPYELLLWFLRTTMTGVVLCFALFSCLALLKFHDHLPLHVTRWVLTSVFMIACSTLPTLYRLSAYDATMERLNRKMDEYAARIPSWSSD
jgi:hypothetical protein